ncbi:hypothetical protein OZD68_05535 [Wolbachia endosymbiont of Drosophila bicornuta]|uniref:hypothetical protein n=1 Tax=Wolbachia endosymbiont of Drosophila bicornuta TaxID=375918 RepID=UPI0023A939EF|nr:hypothetical protein [Wolbachia endosymbiont of Drosophila bicornuta]MDE5057022.1 hypothetical protein [Wolbachia endosymbiont of Drosophila bicornuta]
MANVQILKQKFQCPCDVIPVLDTGIQHFTQSHQERCILHNTFMLTNLIKFLDPSGLCCIAQVKRTGSY